MKREQAMPAALMMALSGMQDSGGLAGGIALGLVMYSLKRWEPPTGPALARARKTAARFRLSEDLAVFLPPEPGMLAGRKVKDAYKALLISLKQLDALEGDQRAEAITQVRMLLGAG